MSHSPLLPLTSSSLAVVCFGETISLAMLTNHLFDHRHGKGPTY
jgi:hypothetical protein